MLLTAVMPIRNNHDENSDDDDDEDDDNYGDTLSLTKMSFFTVNYLALMCEVWSVDKAGGP